MVSRIAIFRALYLGDMLCIIPAVRAIRKAYPTAEIFLVGLPWQSDLVLRFTDYFNHFIEFPGWPGLPEQNPDAEDVIAFLQKIRSYRFDLVLQMQGNGVITNTLCLLWGGEKVYGLRKEGEYCPDPSRFPVSEDGEHEILRFLKLTDSLGIPQQGTHLEFPIKQAERETFATILSASQLSEGRYVCVHPGARDSRRRWPAENFALIASMIASQGFTVVLTGSIEEESILKGIQRKIKGDVLNIVEEFGHLTAGELACILQHARLLVSNDTGVSHIAAALSVPSVILFSKFSDIGRWRPLNESLHTAVPHARTTDVHYVSTCILQKLKECKQAQMKLSKLHVSQSE